MRSCDCGRAYTRPEWDALRLGGTQTTDIETFEMRHCECGSTLSIGRLLVTVSYEVEATDGGWLVFRAAGSSEPIAVGVGERAIVFPTRGAAEAAVEPQRALDRAAAKWLAIDLADATPTNDLSPEEV